MPRLNSGCCDGMAFSLNRLIAKIKMPGFKYKGNFIISAPALDTVESIKSCSKAI